VIGRGAVDCASGSVLLRTEGGGVNTPIDPIRWTGSRLRQIIREAPAFLFTRHDNHKALLDLAANPILDSDCDSA
jgi:hypothetical protein